jgi:hypothetical protein
MDHPDEPVALHSEIDSGFEVRKVDPERVPQHPVGEPGVEISAEDPGLLTPLELRDPRLLGLPQRLAEAKRLWVLK